MLRKHILQFVLFIIFYTTNIILFFPLLFFYLTLYNNNRKLYRIICRYFCCFVNTEALLMTQWCGSSRLIIYTDKKNFEEYFGKEHALCILNHTYNEDWLISHMISNALGMVGNTKAFSKESLQYIPILGPFLKMSENIFLKRTFKEDEQTIINQLKNLTDNPYPFLLILYPEGTRFNSLKHEASTKFAAENNLKPLMYHLQPRTKGFVCCLKAIKGHVPAIYNYQLALYKSDADQGRLTYNFGENPANVHVYIERIPVDHLPNTEDGLNKFLRDLFARKDKLMDSFLTTGDFFETSGIERVDKFVMKETSYWFYIPLLISTVICLPLFYYCVKYLLTFDLTYLGIGTFATVVVIYIMIKGMISEINKKSSYGLNQ